MRASHAHLSSEVVHFVWSESDLLTPEMAQCFVQLEMERGTIYVGVGGNTALQGRIASLV